MSRKKFIIITIIVLIINYLLDFITKQYAITHLKGNAPVYYLYDTIMIYYIENSGAFLSMGSNWPIAVKYILLAALPIAFCLYGIYYCLVKEKNVTRIILFATIIAGGLGNLVDRLLNDFKVVDFLNFGIGNLRTGILNVADLSVTFGAIILVIYEFRQSKKNKLSVADE
ncbi:MAG: signal peptidase II [Bacteroidales bacterium]|nr:signal peptidase II [Bacteroidales bacterium]